MKIKVTWFKSSGEWYASGLVEIPKYCELWHDAFSQAIVDNQTELADGWVEDSFFVVTDTTEEQDNDPTFLEFYSHLFKPGHFSGMRKTK